MVFRVKRIYDAAEPSDGRRYLVDRIWPRGISHAAASIDAWLKELAPSGELRRWYAHDPARWPEFKRRYFRELPALQASWEPLLTEARRGPVTLLFSARDERHNQAVALGEFLKRRSRRIRHK